METFTGVVLLDEKKRIYLIRERDKNDVSQNRWNLPGGSVNNVESLVDSAKRETKEETGYKVKITSLLGCYKCKKGDATWIYSVFKGEMVGGEKDGVDPGVEKGKWFTREEFLNLDASKIVHPDMKLVYKIATENRGLSVESVKYIDYDKG